MKRKSRTIIAALMMVLILTSISTTAYALYYPKSFYDSISWTWSYSGEYTTSYNCLGYATGSMTWEWPWGYKNPTKTQVDSYLKSKGYKTSGTWAYILSYGSSSEITHFSKVTGTSWCRAKWGSLERFNHGSWDPYYKNSGYGPLVSKYYK